MNIGFSQGVVSIKSPQIICAEGSLPDGIDVVSSCDNGIWSTRIFYLGERRINGIVTACVFSGETLSVGINHRHKNTVYRFSPYGNDAVNLLSDYITQHTDISLYIKPAKPEALFIHHDYLNKTLPVIGNVVYDGRCFHLNCGGFCTACLINAETGEYTQTTELSERYRVVIDTKNSLSTLSKTDDGTSRVISITSTQNGERIFLRGSLDA